MTEVDAIAFLLERDFGLDQCRLLSAYQTDSWNYYKDGQYVGHNVEGAEHYGYIVAWSSDANALNREEKSFRTAVEAAQCFLAKKEELHL